MRLLRLSEINRGERALHHFQDTSGGVSPVIPEIMGSVSLKFVIASVSEAIQLRHTKKEWIASSQALLAMTAETQVRVPAARCVRGMPLISRPFQNQGAGNAGRPMRPAVSCAKSSAKTHTSIQVTPESPGIPRAVVYGL
jgi:hypothetical protein